MSIVITATAQCDNCGKTVTWKQTDETRPRWTMSINSITQEIRKLGWSKAFHEYCPDCKKKKIADVGL